MGDANPDSPKASGDYGIPLTKQLWIYGINDHLETPVPDQVKDFNATGVFRTDFSGLCEKYGIIPHTALRPPRKEVDPEKMSEEKVLSVSSQLLDRVSMQLVKCLIPTSLHLETIRFTSCKLDIDMLSLLRGGITDTCTVQTLQIEWNPLEVQIDATQLKSISELSHDDLDEMEKERDKRDAQRRLRVFRELLNITFGNLDAAFAAMKGGNANDQLTLAEWNDLTEDKLKMTTTESAELFDILDGLHFGEGDGKVTFSRLKQVMDQEFLPDLTDEQELADPIGASFAQFVNSTSILENVSFRYCDLGRIEGRQLGEALKSNMHLKSLNLWGNRICDLGVQTIGEALVSHYGLQYLGLGRNQVTHEGLKLLCVGLGGVRVENEADVKELQKGAVPNDAEKAKRQKAYPAPKKDAKGRERHQGPCHFDEIEEKTDEEGKVYWVHLRNTVFETLNLEHNPVSDLKVIQDLQPMGTGVLVLRGTPAAKVFLEEEEQKRKEAVKSATDLKDSGRPAPIEEKEETAAEGGEEPSEPPRPKGWTIHYT